jgi:FixJ family two-component response regulator
MRKLRDRHETLTTREQEVMRQVISGRLNKQIASEPKITKHTVQVSSRPTSWRKVRADSLAYLVRMAKNLGIRSHHRPS